MYHWVCLFRLFDVCDLFSYINSMPMIFAFRIVDCFVCMGPKVLFQVGYVEGHLFAVSANIVI